MNEVVEPHRRVLRVGFVGAGKAGCSIGRYLSERIHETARSDIVISGYYSRTHESSAFAAKLTASNVYDTLAALISESDIVMLSVPDDSIEDLWLDILCECQEHRLSVSEKAIGHLSGSLSSAVFCGIQAVGASCFSLHPVCAMPDRENAWRGLGVALFTFEGTSQSRAAMDPVLKCMGNRIGNIDSDKKVLYHAACVFLSNLAVGLAEEGISLLTDCGLDRTFADECIGTLFKGNADNIALQGTVAALTGPAERADAKVIARHVDVLSRLDDDAALRIYTELTKTIVRIAAKKHPHRDYADVLSLL